MILVKMGMYLIEYPGKRAVNVWENDSTAQNPLCNVAARWFCRAHSIGTKKTSPGQKPGDEPQNPEYRICVLGQACDAQRFELASGIIAAHYIQKVLTCGRQFNAQIVFAGVQRSPVSRSDVSSRQISQYIANVRSLRQYYG